MAEVPELRGVIPILPTPFTEHGEIDERSFRRVIDAAVEDGANAVALFGLASEYAKLSDLEKKRLTEVLVDQVAKRVPVIISMTHHSLEVARREAAEAAAAGADLLMVLPPFFLSPSTEAVQRHIREVASASGLPIIVQYAPAQTGSTLRLDTLRALKDENPHIQYIKVDMVPSGPMVTQVRAAGFAAMVGYMGLHFPEDFERGASAVMPTVSVCKAFVTLWGLLQDDLEDAIAFHRQLLPLLVSMMQSVELLVAVEKIFLYRRGLIDSSYCRAPGWSPDTFDLQQIDRLLRQHSVWLSAQAGDGRLQ